MSIDATGTATLLGSVFGSGAASAPGLPGLRSSQRTTAAGFGPAALLNLGATAADNVLQAAYGNLQQRPTARTSEKQRKEFQKTLGNAMAAHATGNTAGAKAQIQGLLKKDPTYALAYQALGNIALDKKDYVEAERMFRRADYLGPQYGFKADAENAAILQKGDGAVIARAKILVGSSSSRDDGIRLLVGLTQRTPDNAEARILLGDALLSKGDAVNGIDQLRLALDSASSTQLGGIESRVRGLIAKAPGSAILRNILGQTQLARGDAQGALQSLQTATQLADGDPSFAVAEAPAWVAVGREALGRNDFNSALSALQRARDRDYLGEETRIAQAEGFAARAHYRLRLGAAKDAVSDFREAALTLSSFGDEAFRRRTADGAYRAGLILAARRQAAGEPVGDEVLAFQAAFDLDRTNVANKRRLADTRVAIGDEFASAGKYKDAAYSYKRAWELFNNDATYRGNAVDAFSRYAEQQLTALDYDRAIEMYGEAHRIDRDRADARQGLAGAHNARGLDHLANGRISAALEDFREAVRLDPENAAYAQHLADLD